MLNDKNNFANQIKSESRIKLWEITVIIFGVIFNTSFDANTHNKSTNNFIFIAKL